VHRSTCLLPEDCVTVDGIPCLSVPATLLSLGAMSPRNVLERACNQAEINRSLDMKAMAELLGRRPAHPGASRLRAVLAMDGLGADRTKSHLERRFARLAREHGIPAPEVNAWIAIPGEMQCDFAWHRERLIVEVDGWDTHRTRRAFHDDRRRDRLLQAAGWYVLRFTDRDVRGDPEHVTAVVRTLLQRPRAPTLGAVVRPYT
jgi:very-short-patch-repair endonuclease